MMCMTYLSYVHICVFSVQPEGGLPRSHAAEAAHVPRCLLSPPAEAQQEDVRTASCHAVRTLDCLTDRKPNYLS